MTRDNGVRIPAGPVITVYLLYQLIWLTVVIYTYLYVSDPPPGSRDMHGILLLVPLFGSMAWLYSVFSLVRARARDYIHVSFDEASPARVYFVPFLLGFLFMGGWQLLGMLD